METRAFFLEQYETVRAIVNDLFLRGLDDDQLRHQPSEGLNSIAWYLWHTSRWQDFAKHPDPGEPLSGVGRSVGSSVEGWAP